MGEDERASWWTTVWWRAGLLHPLLFVAPWVALCLALAASADSDLGDIGWGFLVIPASAVASFITSFVMALRHPLSIHHRTLVVLLGLLASGIAFVVGGYAWFHAAETACHGGYECPF